MPSQPPSRLGPTDRPPRVRVWLAWCPDCRATTWAQVTGQRNATEIECPACRRWAPVASRALAPPAGLREGRFSTDPPRPPRAPKGD